MVIRRQQNDNPIYRDILHGSGGRAGGRFVLNDNEELPVYGFLSQYDGPLLLQLEGNKLYRRK
jgi:hypothetical protein